MCPRTSLRTICSLYIVIKSNQYIPSLSVRWRCCQRTCSRTTTNVSNTQQRTRNLRIIGLSFHTGKRPRQYQTINNYCTKQTSTQKSYEHMPCHEFFLFGRRRSLGFGALFLSSLFRSFRWHFPWSRWHSSNLFCLYVVIMT